MHMEWYVLLVEAQSDNNPNHTAILFGAFRVHPQNSSTATEVADSNDSCGAAHQHVATTVRMYVRPPQCSELYKLFRRIVSFMEL